MLFKGKARGNYKSPREAELPTSEPVGVALLSGDRTHSPYTAWEIQLYMRM